MGSCVTKRALGRPHIVPFTQATNDYDMSQLARSFLFALSRTLSTGPEVQLVAAREPFYRVLKVRGDTNTAIRSQHGTLVGLFLTYATEREVKEVGYACNQTGTVSSISLHLAEGEYIRRVMVGYSDDRAEALELHTTSRVSSSGDVMDCQYVMDLDFRDQDLGVVGFAARFAVDTLAELSVYTAPVMARTSLVPFELQQVEGISLALVAVPCSRSIRHQRELREDQASVKECFQSAKNRQRSSMNLANSPSYIL